MRPLRLALPVYISHMSFGALSREANWVWTSSPSMGAQDSVPIDAVPLVVLFGLGRYGNGIARTLRERGWRVLGVEFNPDLVHAGDAMGRPDTFGDAEDPESIATLRLGRTLWVVSTAGERHVNLSLVHSLRSRGYSGRIAITAQAPDLG